MKNNKRVPDPELSTLMPLLINVWRHFTKEGGPKDSLQTREFRRVVESVKAIQDGLSGDYFKDPDVLGAYILYHWVVHYQQGLSIFNELPTTPKKVLDLCSGPLAFSFAALRHGANDVLAVDRNMTALKLGAEVCGRYGLPVTVRQGDCMKNAFPAQGNFDLIILGYCLKELFPEQEKGWQDRQHEFVNQLLHRLTPHGHLVIVDESDLETNRRILQLRDLLVGQGVPVQAPCVWRGECPALKTKGSPCYAQREFEKPTLIKEIQRAAQINLSSLKMSYVIFRNPQAKWPTLPTQPHFRVISPPVDAYQGTRYYLCGTDGKKTLGSHLSDHPAQSKAFEYLRRGELISIRNALETGQSLDIIKDTIVAVEAACGKPLQEDERGSII